MGFLWGRDPIRRTAKYISAGKLIFKNNLQIFALNYNFFLPGYGHQGMKDFAYWNVPQIQYKNPQVQIHLIRDKAPTPYIQCFFENNKRMLIDCYGKSKEEIMEHCIKVLGKSPEETEREDLAARRYLNPADIGNGCEKHCICEVPGQVPCPSVVPLPYHMRGKYIYEKADYPTD